jgi:hypothetical protein
MLGAGDRPPSCAWCWTKLDTPEGYRGLVSVAREVAGAVPLAEWELGEYQRRAPAARRDRRYQ